MSKSEKRVNGTLNFLMGQFYSIPFESSAIQKLLSSQNRNLKPPALTRSRPQEDKPASLIDLNKQKTLTGSLTDHSYGKDTFGSTFYNPHGSPGLYADSIISPRLEKSILGREKSANKRLGQPQIQSPIDERLFGEDPSRKEQKPRSVTTLVKNLSNRSKVGNNLSSKGSPGLDPKGIVDVISSKSRLELTSKQVTNEVSQRMNTGDNDDVSVYAQSPNTLKALDVDKRGKKKRPVKREYVIEKEVDAITKVAMSNMIRRKSCCCSECGGMSKFEQEKGNVAIFSNREQYNAQKILEHKLLEQKVKERVRAYANSKNNGNIGGSAMSFRNLDLAEDISPISPSVRSKLQSVLTGIKFLTGIKREKSSPAQLVQPQAFLNGAGDKSTRNGGKNKRNVGEEQSFPSTLIQLRSENESPSHRKDVAAGSQNKGTILMNDGGSPLLKGSLGHILDDKDNLKFETLISGLIYKETDEDDSKSNGMDEKNDRSPGGPIRKYLLSKASDMIKVTEPLNPERKGRELVPSLPLNIKVKNLMKSKSKSKRKDEIRYVLTTREDDGPRVVRLPTLENHPKSRGFSFYRKKSQKDMIKDVYGLNNDYDWRMPSGSQTQRYHQTVESNNSGNATTLTTKPDKIYIFDLESPLPAILSHSTTTKNIMGLGRKKFSVDLKKPRRDFHRSPDMPQSTRVSQGRSRREVLTGQTLATERGPPIMGNEQKSLKILGLLKMQTEGSFENPRSKSTRKLNPSLNIKLLEHKYKIQGKIPL